MKHEEIKPFYVLHTYEWTSEKRTMLLAGAWCSANHNTIITIGRPCRSVLVICFRFNSNFIRISKLCEYTVSVRDGKMKQMGNTTLST